MSARDEVLDRIRRAREGAAVPDVPRDYRSSGQLPAGSAAVLDLLEDRLLDYQATVTRCSAEELPQTLARLLGPDRVIMPAGLDPAWSVDGRRDDGSLQPHALDEFDAVVTAATAAAAETGTIVLDGSDDQGRRSLSLVPDHHVCVLRPDQVVHSVPELVARLEPTRPLTFISGPSATSDIELERVEGVHGPRRLDVVLLA